MNASVNDTTPANSKTDAAVSAPHSDLANCLRALAMDAVEAANSGHPGMPMGMADVATVLYRDFLKFDSSNPTWPDRDRFVLSAGHGSMLLYGLSYLTGYEGMTLDQIKNFRKLGSHTAGHPEVDPALGIETTTGPLGQGIATAVGFAIAEAKLRQQFGEDLVNHYTYVLASDGDLMEGISHEACSLAGHLGLSKMIVLYDDNQISIDGATSLSFSDNSLQRFESYGWNAVAIDGHDEGAIGAAISAAKTSKKPTLIACRTTIGFGAPNKGGTSGCHGSPLGAVEVAAAREKLGWPYAPFEIPANLKAAWEAIGHKGHAANTAWKQRLNTNANKAAFEATISGTLPQNPSAILKPLCDKITTDKPSQATRTASGACLEYLVAALPTLIGGSADLTPSNNTRAKAMTAITPTDFSGEYIHFGVREHAMAAAMNGMALHGGFIPYGGTFLVFSDYCRPSIRLSALMGTQVVYIMTHDSIGLGEDGPTHQPVEHLAALRAIPNLAVLRPCDGIETAECWDIALNSKKRPSLMALSRQNVPTLRTAGSENLSAKGAYIISPAAGGAKPSVILYASGTEVSLAVDTQTVLANQGITAAVVSVPWLEGFYAQPASYRQTIAPAGVLRVAIEAAIRQPWDRLIGEDGLFFGVETFGASAPAHDVYKHFGLTAEHISHAVANHVSGHLSQTQNPAKNQSVA